MIQGDYFLSTGEYQYPLIGKKRGPIGTQTTQWAD